MQKDDFLILKSRLTPADAVAALIVLEDGRYLMQSRDRKAGIFYPGYWGLFGGAVDHGEDRLTALKRELMEELGLLVKTAVYFTCFDFDFSFAGCGKLSRTFYEVSMKASNMAQLVLREGAGMMAFTASEILSEGRVVPYDGFALWLHANRQAFASDQFRTESIESKGSARSTE
jgi:ADP-ribose pyrophosphatase YjhB (NUDIX family)